MSEFEILTKADGTRYAVLADAPTLLVPVDEGRLEHLRGEGFAEESALALAIQAPFRRLRQLRDRRGRD